MMEEMDVIWKNRGEPMVERFWKDCSPWKDSCWSTVRAGRSSEEEPSWTDCNSSALPWGLGLEELGKRCWWGDGVGFI